MHDLRAPFHHWTRPWIHSGARGATSTHIRTRTVEHATPFASATISGRTPIEAHAQRGAEISGEPEVTVRAQESTEREPWPDRQT